MPRPWCQDWRQWWPTLSSGRNGIPRCRTSSGIFGSWRPGEYILRQYVMSTGSGSRGRCRHQNVLLWESAALTTVPETTSALYGRALALVTPVLKKRHKIYLHSFSAGLAEFQLWYRFFSNLLVGCSWLMTSDFSRMDLLRVLPTTVIALETDSPHLSPRVGVVNSPYQVYEQAAAIGELRDLPTSTVLECSNRALRQFYALWIGPRERFLTWVNERSDNETRMDNCTSYLLFCEFLDPTLVEYLRLTSTWPLGRAVTWA